MKLHLPKTLLVAVLAACVAPAWAFGPTEVVDGETQNISYTEVSTATGTTAVTPTSDTYYSNVTGAFNITAGEGVDVKLGQSSNNGDEVNLGTISAASTWLANGRFLANNNSALSNAGNLYINGGALQIQSSLTITNNITLGESTYGQTGWASYPLLNSAALIIGTHSQTDQTVTLGGTLTIAETAKVVVQDGYKLNISGALSGSQNLTFATPEVNGKESTLVTLSGSVVDYSGSIETKSDDESPLTLKLTGNATGLLSNSSSTITVGANTKLDLSAVEDLTFDDTLAGKIANSGSIIIDEAVTVNTTESIGTLEIVSLDGFGERTSVADTCVGGAIKGNGFEAEKFKVISDDSTGTVEGIRVIALGAAVSTTDADGYALTIKDSSTTFAVKSRTERLTQAIVNKASTYRVSDEATLDINGQKLAEDKVILEAGATLTNTGNATGETQKQLPKLELTGDATVSAASGKDYGLIEGSYNESKLTLGGHKLTKTGDGTFYLVNTTVEGGGTIEISEGTLMIGSSGGANKTSTADSTVIDTLTGGTLKLTNSNTLKAEGVKGTGGKITGTAGTGIELDSANNYSFGGAVEGSVDLTKKGSGTQTFTGTTALDAVEVQVGKVAFASDSASVNSANVTGGTLEIANGKTLTATDAMTIGAGTLALSSENAFAVTGAMTFNAGAQLSYTLTATPADTDTKLSYTLGRADSFAGLDNLTYTGNTPDGYTGLLSADGNNLMLNFVLTEMELTSITVTEVVRFADGVLTLKTDAANALAYVFGEQLDVAIDDDLWKSAIADVTDGNAQAFSISLQNAEGSEISFGENQLAVVLNSQSGTVLSPTTAGTYSVPEPTTATLSLLALAALAARRRRR